MFYWGNALFGRYQQNDRIGAFISSNTLTLNVGVFNVGADFNVMAEDGNEITSWREFKKIIRRAKKLRMTVRVLNGGFMIHKLAEYIERHIAATQWVTDARGQTDYKKFGRYRIYVRSTEFPQIYDAQRLGPFKRQDSEFWFPVNCMKDFNTMLFIIKNAHIEDQRFVAYLYGDDAAVRAGREFLNTRLSATSIIKVPYKIDVV